MRTRFPAEECQKQDYQDFTDYQDKIVRRQKHPILEILPIRKILLLTICQNGYARVTEAVTVGRFAGVGVSSIMTSPITQMEISAPDRPHGTVGRVGMN